MPNWIVSSLLIQFFIAIICELAETKPLQKFLLCIIIWCNTSSDSGEGLCRIIHTFFGGGADYKRIRHSSDIDSTELLEIERFLHLIECKQTTEV